MENKSEWFPSEILDRSPHDAFSLPETGPLAVVVCHFNPCLYEAPVRNLNTVLQWLACEGVPTYAVEVRSGFSLRAPAVLPESSRVLHFDAVGTMFRKDNLWNIAARFVPVNFPYILCLDADVILAAVNWKEVLLESLDKNLIVQPFDNAIWTDSARVPFKEKMSCGFGFTAGSEGPQISHNFHSGFALAAPRSFWAETEGFYNCPIGGGSLFFMSAIMGLPNELEPKLETVSPSLLYDYRQWAEIADSWCGRSFGYVPGQAMHLWHGSRAKRRYRDRFDLLFDFDPRQDVQPLPPHGLHEWTASAFATKSDLVGRVEQYFVTREEDELYLTD